MLLLDAGDTARIHVRRRIVDDVGAVGRREGTIPGVVGALADQEREGERRRCRGDDDEDEQTWQAKGTQSAMALREYRLHRRQPWLTVTTALAISGFC